jgi:hypothetical protein
MNELDAGRELDARIAETVLGWRWFMHRPGLEGSSIPGQRFLYPPDTAAVREGVFVLAPPDAPLADSLTSYYSTDLAAAWEIVEHMRARDYRFACEDRLGTDGPWWVEFATEEYELGGQAHERTFPLAVCWAALAAIGDRR